MAPLLKSGMAIMSGGGGGGGMGVVRGRGKGVTGENLGTGGIREMKRGPR